MIRQFLKNKGKSVICLSGSTPSSSTNYSRAHGKFKLGDYLHYHPRVVQLPPTAMNIYDSRGGGKAISTVIANIRIPCINYTRTTFKPNFRSLLSTPYFLFFSRATGLKLCRDTEIARSKCRIKAFKKYPAH